MSLTVDARSPGLTQCGRRAHREANEKVNKMRTRGAEEKGKENQVNE